MIARLLHYLDRQGKERALAASQEPFRRDGQGDPVTFCLTIVVTAMVVFYALFNRLP